MKKNEEEELCVRGGKMGTDREEKYWERVAK